MSLPPPLSSSSSNVPCAAEFGAGIKTEDFVNFIDSGRNILIATSSDGGAAVQDIASQVGLEIDEAGAAVIDHVSNAGSSTIVKATKVSSMLHLSGVAQSLLSWLMRH